MKRLVVNLAVLELRRRPLATLIDTVAVTAALATVLILYGLKFGVVDQLARQVIDDPRHLRVVLTPDPVFLPADIEALRANPRVGWMVPSQASLSQQLHFKRADAMFFPTRSMPVIPSGAGDPLLPEGVSGPDPKEAILSAALAAELEIELGDAIVAEARRESGRETVNFELRVSAVVDLPEVLSKGALLEHSVLAEVERWAVGGEVPERGWSGAPDNGERYFNAVRLYARSLGDLDALTAELNARPDWTARKRTREVSRVLALDGILRGVFAMFLIVVAAAFSIAFTSSMCSRVLRARQAARSLALVGVEHRALALFPLVQSVAIATLGFGLGTLIYALVAGVLNRTLADKVATFGLDSDVCRLLPHHFWTCLAGLLVLTTLAALSARRVDARMRSGSTEV